MYRAKELGRAAFQFYSADMSARANERVILEGELRRALRLNQFDLRFQPQVLTESGEIVGMEALLRWSHPELGSVPPDRFIPVAEETGLIMTIGQWVLRAACAQNKAWQRSGFQTLPIAVNVSAVQLKHPDFVDMVGDVLAETGLDPRWLELEITESLMMEKNESMIARLRELQARGIGLSMDDFGTGYSNLGYLQSFPLNRLKIDQSFVQMLPDDANAASIVSAILAIGESLGLQVIAEGVETERQAEFLIGAGCKYAQGFLFGRPLTAVDIETMLLAQSRTRPNMRLRPANPVS
jgi:EAL domain-containing protein (putative c-di-GMP-specific phosphodiesterase class I)